MREQLIKHLSDNVALFDCQGDCPDEETQMMVKPDEYCNTCFADQIIALVKEAGYVKLADDQSLPDCQTCIDCQRMGSPDGTSWRCYGQRDYGELKRDICDGDKPPKVAPDWCPHR